METSSDEEVIDIARVDDERKHLEGLLKDRINFYIVFASVFMAGLSRTDNAKVRLAALIAATLVSILIGLAVYRTHRLVTIALREIRHDEKHPYTRYAKTIRFPGNANRLLLGIPIIFTVFFVIAIILNICR